MKVKIKDERFHLICDNGLNNTIDYEVRMLLDAYYKELSDTELLDEIMDCIDDYE